jgi:hypothetical protein
MLLQLFEVPNAKFELINMGLIVSILKTQFDYDSLFVIVDPLTKIAQFIPTVTTMAYASWYYQFIYEEMFSRFMECYH